MPAAAQACFSNRQVVLLPRAQSVPITAMIGASTVKISPVQKCRSFLFFGFLTSISSTLYSVANNCSEGILIRKSCNPFTKEMPFRIQDSRMGIKCTGNFPPTVASPMIQYFISPIASTAFSTSPTTGIFR